MRAVIGLGANLGDRLATLRLAVRWLREVSVVLAVSRVYETDPVGGPPQPAYLNAAASIATDLPPDALLDVLLAIEAALGRTRGEHWGPRVIDLDLLWLEGMAVATERLVVPHPRLHERAFAMVPLLEVMPDALDPVTRAPLVAPPHEGIRATKLRLQAAPARAARAAQPTRRRA